MITEATQLWRILFSRFCCSINRQSPHLHKNAIQDISFYVNLWVTRRCYVHHYRLREAGCLINLLETSVPLIRMTQPRDMRALFSVIFLITSLGLGLRSRFRGQRTVLDRMLMVVFALSTQRSASSLQLNSESGQGSMASSVSTNPTSSPPFLMPLTTLPHGRIIVSSTLSSLTDLRTLANL